MSREILFKAKRANWRELPKEERWVEGFYVKCRGRHYILPVYDTDHGYDERYAEWIEVDPETICQYIGVKDKNKKEIYEKDIVLIDGEDEYFTVEWNDDTARFVMTSETLTVDFDNYWGYQVEIISNIFNNPELLNGGQQLESPITHKEEAE